jgi:hypothetical protein
MHLPLGLGGFECSLPCALQSDPDMASRPCRLSVGTVRWGLVVGCWSWDSCWDDSTQGVCLTVPQSKYAYHLEVSSWGGSGASDLSQ